MTINMNLQAPNFDLLREQKDTLLKIMFKPEDYPNLTAKDIEHIEGIVTYLDYVQDTAVDECGVPENQVFHCPVDETDDDEPDQAQA